jgi:peptidyl-prolyl cis-trans isomerase B (cyclophilin B)
MYRDFSNSSNNNFINKLNNWLASHFQPWLVLFLATAVFLGGCTANTQQAISSDKSPLATITPVPSQAAKAVAPSPVGSPKQGASNLPRLAGKATVVLVVKGSPITIELNGDKAPITAGNFVDIVQKGVYDGLVFHRVVREPQPFVVQGGDPLGKDPAVPLTALGMGGFVDPATGLPRNIPLEITPKGATEPIYSQTFPQARVTVPPELTHTRGAVAMARSQAPDSASSQFYIALADLPFLDGSYAVFGYVTAGMEVVDQIQQGDRITSAKVTQGLENLKN